LDRSASIENNTCKDKRKEPTMSRLDTMTATQQSPTWRLRPGQALSLPAVRRARWLRVVDGEAWLTAASAPGQPAEDRWLQPGGLWLLPAGRDAVIEGHPRASFQLLEPALSAASPSWTQTWRAWWRRLSMQPASCEAG
jgi:hypothetical protein